MHQLWMNREQKVHFRIFSYSPGHNNHINIYMRTINSMTSSINDWNILNIALTKDRQLLVSLQGFLPGERKVKPPCPCQVDLHGATKDLHIWRCPFNSLTSHLHPHARHDHRTVVVHCFHSKSSRLEQTEWGSVNGFKTYDIYYKYIWSMTWFVHVMCYILQHFCHRRVIFLNYPYLCVCHIHPSGVESVFDLLSIVHLQQVITPKLNLGQLLVVFEKVHWECHLTGRSGRWNWITMLKFKCLQDVLNHSYRQCIYLL